MFTPLSITSHADTNRPNDNFLFGNPKINKDKDNNQIEKNVAEKENKIEQANNSIKEDDSNENDDESDASTDESQALDSNSEEKSVGIFGKIKRFGSKLYNMPSTNK